MLHLIKKHFFLFSLCLLTTACSPYREFYIPVHNQIETAPPLSTTDIIRVVINEDQADQPTGISNHETLLKTAKLETEKRLLEMGYTVINTRHNTDNRGNPNVIILIQAGQKGIIRDVEKTWKEPLFTDTMGNATTWQMKGITISYFDLYYNMMIIRPRNADNSLLTCINIIDKMCAKPNNIGNYDTIFKSNATLTTNSPNKGMESLVYASFYQYPFNGNKKIYFNNPYNEIIRVEDLNPTKNK